MNPEINMKVLPPVTQKVQAALQVLELLETSHSFMISGPDNPELKPMPGKSLDSQEIALKKAALGYLVHYFHGEMD